MMADYSKAITTICGECDLRLEGWKGLNNEPAWAYLALLSAHEYEWRHQWKNRLSLAWKSLRAKSHGGWVELHTADETDCVIAALQECRKVLWGDSDGK